MPESRKNLSYRLTMVINLVGRVMWSNCLNGLATCGPEILHGGAHVSWHCHFGVAFASAAVMSQVLIGMALTLRQDRRAGDGLSGEVHRRTSTEKIAEAGAASIDHSPVDGEVTSKSVDNILFTGNIRRVGVIM
ncbi:MAG: hypothetical protein Q8P60_13465 [Pseudorhodobacter sp.]|nr:hypothetical protein [Pseudorhodobacter sp.]